MRIAIDLTPLFGRKHTGVELYAIDLYRALLKTGNPIIPIFHMENELDDNSNSIVIYQTNRLILENFKLSAAIRKIKADVTLFPIFPPPVDLYISRPTKIVPVIHDTAFIRYHETLKFAAKYYLTPKYNLALKYADYIVSISDTAKKQLEDYSKVPVLNWGENISKEFMPKNIRINVNALKQFGVTPNNYYISVSTIEPRKNFKFLLKSIRSELASTGRKLVLVGRKGWGKDKELKQIIDDMKGMIVFTGYVSTEALQSLYHYAYAFTLLSLDEGFGRTPLEAIACGCRKIIVSDIDVFHETLGKSGNYIPLGNIDNAQEFFEKDVWNEVEQGFSVPFDEIEKRISFI